MLLLVVAIWSVHTRILGSGRTGFRLGQGKTSLPFTVTLHWVSQVMSVINIYLHYMYLLKDRITWLKCVFGATAVVPSGPKNGF